MTWKDIKLATIQKMFSADGSTIPSDDSTRDYIAAMPYAANEGILMMSTAGKFLVKTFSIAVQPIKNMITQQIASPIHSMTSGDLEFSADNAHSFYFEVTGRCTVTIVINDTTVYSETIDALNKYEIYKGILATEENKKAVMTFTSDRPYAVKNVAIYEAKYDENSEVPAYAEKIRYKVTDIVEDFHSVNSIYFEGDNPRYVKTDEVYQEGDKVLVFDRR